MKNLAFIQILFLSLLSQAIFAQAGTLDPDFGLNGSVGLPNMDVATGALELENQSIVVSGGLLDGELGAMIFTKLMPNGQVDESFGENGTVHTPLAWSAVAFNIQAYDMDHFVASGSLTEDNISGVIAKFDLDGSLDSTFGVDGKVQLSLGAEMIMTGLQVVDDKILLSSFGDDGFRLFQIKENGSIDSEFGNDGVVDFSPDGYSNFYFPRVQVYDSKIFLAGIIKKGNEYGFAIVRFGLNGQLDSSFGIGGLVFHPSPVIFSNTVRLFDIRDNRIVIGANSSQHPTVARFLIDGSFDTTFGDNGLAVMDIPDLSIYGCAIQPDGKIVVSGNFDYVQVLFRLNDDGSQDMMFGTYQGLALWLNDDYEAYNFDLKLLADNSIMAIGANDDDEIGLVSKYRSGLVANNDLNINDLSLSVYPNPVVKEFNLTFKLNTSQQVDVSLYSLSGKLIQVLDSRFRKKGTQHLELVVPQVPKGNYMLLIKTKKATAPLLITLGK